MTPKYCTIGDWQRLSGMGRTRVFEALANGELKAIKLGRRTLIDTEAGLAWLAAQPAWRPLSSADAAS